MPDFPFEYEDLDEETDKALKRDFRGHTRGMIKVKPYNLIIPPEFKNYAEKIYNMEVRPNDVWVVTYAKAGTTWTQAAVWSILNDGELDMLKENPKLYNWRFLEVDTIAKDGTDLLLAENRIPERFKPFLDAMANHLGKAENDPRDSTRLIKTHIPFPMLPQNLLDTTKVVYVARNPRDVCVSFYHHHKAWFGHGFQGDFESFFDYFVKDLVLFSPYWRHVVDAWNRRNHPNMLFLFYEDMKKDFGAALRKLAGFLNKPISDELVQYLLEELSVGGMKRNPAMNAENAKEMGMMTQEGSFIRKGIVGDWKNHFTPEMEKRMEEWSKKGREGSDIKFPGE